MSNNDAIIPASDALQHDTLLEASANAVPSQDANAVLQAESILAASGHDTESFAPDAMDAPFSDASVLDTSHLEESYLDTSHLEESPDTSEESFGAFIPDDTHPPCVSVIINCYNGSATLDTALWSVLAQDFTDWEIVFWDNGSSDDSVTIVQGYAREYGPIIRPFRTETTCPLGAARNKAIEQARGEYIAFLDCDDLWQPEKLSAQVAIMNANSRVALVCTDTEILHGETSLGRVFRKSAPARGAVFPELVMRQWMAMSSVMIRRAALDELDRGLQYFDEDLQICEEAELFYTLSQRWECDYVDDVLTCWHLHTRNTTLQHIESLWKETSYILKKHQANFDVHNTAHMAARDMLHSRVTLHKAIALWQQGHPREARAILRHATKPTLKMPLVSLLTLLPPSCLPLSMRAYFVLETFCRGIL